MYRVRRGIETQEGRLLRVLHLWRHALPSHSARPKWLSLVGRFDFLKDNYAKVGFWGIIIAALCCFTPLLVWTFAAIGLATYVAYLDYLLLPILGCALGY
jgi:mercuric ion transport protein